MRPECGRSILLVEDDRFVRGAAGDLLRGWGLQVLEAQNAATARDIFSRRAVRVHALLCDVILPDGSGIERAASYRARPPVYESF
jgi:CheY-like chemotaxis protein